ncbi:hypothetical protein FQA39_LY04852 [Lamprigera yunnana]|nr:hypothetical protein FQA39_LY04852 [Lamprigera yunnana]
MMCQRNITDVLNLDQKISFHSNRICLISLAENHIVIKNRKRIIRLNCCVGNNVNRLLNVTSGKGKRGAQKLNPDSVLCYIECDDGTSYPVYSCVTGKLLEINEKLVTDPNLLINKPVSDGYIALILPVLNLYNSIKDSMTSANKYFE